LTTMLVGEYSVHFAGLLENKQVLWDFLKKRLALNALVACQAPVEECRACALAIVAQRKMQNSPAHDLLQYLDSSSRPVLRDMVSASDDPLNFHYCTAATLAYLGDPGLIPILESRRAAFRSTSPRYEEVLVEYLWLIRVQNPPSKLVEYIGSDHEKDTVLYRRGIAIRRARELGIPDSEIRSAILDHVSHFENPQNLSVGHPLVQLKELARGLGILHENDLADVPCLSL
ncbi:MAG TPA: hypothetical protein VNT79_16195, partial [Phycisphaerae bacterium]|nr:hypothetical protein [Phycisphaerae bacterium]